MKLTVNGNFQPYYSFSTLPNIPYNSLTSGSYNVQVFTGIIAGRRQFKINANVGYNNQQPTGIAAYKNIGTSNEKYRFVCQRYDSTTTTTFEVLKFDKASTASLVSLTPVSIGGTFPMKTEFYQNVLYISDGSTPGYKYFIDGTTDYFEPNGIPKPSGIAFQWFTTGGSGGFEAGDTAYRYTYVYKVGSTYEWEGPADSNSVNTQTTTTAGAGRVVLTLNQPDATDAESHITHFRIYRKHPSQDRYYFVEEVAVTGTGSTQNYTDDDGTVFDTTRPLYEVDSFDNEFEANSQIDINHFGIRLHKGIMFYASTDGITLRFSQPGLPESVPSKNLFIVGGSNDPIMELISTDNSLIIVKKFSIWQITGTNVYDFELEQIANWGSFLPNMTFSHLGYLYGINQSGIWRWDGNDKPDFITNQISRDFRYANTYYPSRTTQTYSAKDFDIVGNYTREQLSLHRYAIDGNTGYIWFDCAFDDDSLLGCYVYDPISNAFMGKFSFPHTALTNLKINESASYVFCAYQTSSTPTWNWAVYTFDGLTTDNTFADLEWEAEGNLYHAVSFGGKYSEDIKEDVQINYAMAKVSFTGTANISVVDSSVTSVKPSHSFTASVINKFGVNRHGDGLGLMIERETVNFLIYRYGIDVENEGIW